MASLLISSLRWTPQGASALDEFGAHDVAMRLYLAADGLADLVATASLDVVGQLEAGAACRLDVARQCLEAVEQATAR